MKRFLYSLLFVAASGFTLASCNNGDYDANPDASYADIDNPMMPPNKGVPEKGQFIAKVSGAWRVFTNASYVALGGQRFITGSYQSQGKSNVVQITLNGYDSAKSYDITAGNLAVFSSVPTANPADVTQYSTESPVQTGSGNVTVTTDANDEMKGTFYFTAYKELPIESSSEKIIITEGRFFVPKM